MPDEYSPTTTRAFAMWAAEMRAAHAMLDEVAAEMARVRDEEGGDPTAMLLNADLRVRWERAVEVGLRALDALGDEKRANRATLDAVAELVERGLGG